MLITLIINIYIQEIDVVRVLAARNNLKAKKYLFQTVRPGQGDKNKQTYM